MGRLTLASARSLLLFAVLLLATIPMTMPVNAVRKQPPAIPTCWEAAGIAPDGSIHSASFYRRWMANRQAAIWAAAGWTGIIVDSC